MLRWSWCWSRLRRWGKSGLKGQARSLKQASLALTNARGPTKMIGAATFEFTIESVGSLLTLAEARF